MDLSKAVEIIKYGLITVHTKKPLIRNLEFTIMLPFAGRKVYILITPLSHMDGTILTKLLPFPPVKITRRVKLRSLAA